MEEYKVSNIKRYATTNEQLKFATQPSKIVAVESFRRRAGSLVSSGERVLDIGGGAGVWTGIFQEEGLQVETFALDISFSMLKERSESDLCTVGDIEQLPFESESFDRAFFFASLHHVKNTRRALQEVRRIIRSGGYLVLCEPVSLRLLLLNKNIAPVDNTQYCFSIRYLLSLLKDLDFRLISVYYRGLFRRILPRKSPLQAYRICDKLDDMLDKIPLLRTGGALGDNVTLVAQKHPVK